MRALLIVLVLAGGCRTRLLDDSDASAPIDLSTSGRPSPADLSSTTKAADLAAAVDLASSVDLARSPCAPCSPSQICVFIDRGDCSSWTCAPRPAACGSTVTCDCVGAGFCNPFARTGEQLTCKPPYPMLGGDVICDSPTKCI